MTRGREIEALTALVGELEASSDPEARQLVDELKRLLHDVRSSEEPLPPVEVEEFVVVAVLLGRRMQEYLCRSSAAATGREPLQPPPGRKRTDYSERIRLWREVRREKGEWAPVRDCAREVARRRNSEPEAERVFFYRNRSVIDVRSPRA